MTALVPLKRVARMAYGDALSAEQRIDGEYPVVGSGGVSGTHSVSNFQSPGIVIGRKGSYGSIHWVPTGGFAIDTAYYIDSRLTDADLRWLYYALNAVDLRGVSQDVGVPGLSRETAYGVLLPKPPSLTEQRRIADFLDVETSRIDRLRNRRRRQLGLLVARESVKLSDAFRSCKTGRETRLKYLMRVKPRYGVLVPSFVDEGVRFIRVNDLLDLSGRAQSLAQIPSELSKQYARTVTLPGDVLLSVVGTMGRAAVVPPELAGANVARAVASLRPLEAIDPHLVATWLRTSDFLRQALDATGSDTAQPTLGMEDLGNIRLVWPSDTGDQNHLALRVTEIQEAHAKLATTLERQNELLVRRRQALITAAVTGQFDVFTASGRGVEE